MEEILFTQPGAQFCFTENRTSSIRLLTWCNNTDATEYFNTNLNLYKFNSGHDQN